MEFTIKIADVNIGITSVFDGVSKLCKDYLTDECPDFCIRTDLEDIAFEREKAKREAAFEHRPYFDFSDAYLETLAAYRKIAVGILPFDAFLMHGAVVGRGGEAYLFTAPSGVGKTTHTRFWLQNFKDAFIVNGDKPILRFKDGAVYACGTPWAGKEGENKNVMLPLKSVCILSRGKTNEIERVDFGRIYPLLIGQAYRPATEKELSKTMSLIKKLGESTAFYLLKCNLDPNAAKVAFEGMNG
ncbi:MAG: hypothetical protein IKZ47_04200 [Clostridia bacterium]|nr:hypothetical protein [Clostridia bacterium]